MIAAVSSTRPVATCASVKPKAVSIDSAIALACTLLKINPYENTRHTENATPSHGAFSPRAM